MLSDQELNKNKRIRIEDKAKLNLTNYYYLEFVHSHYDEIKSKSENVYPNNGLYKDSIFIYSNIYLRRYYCYSFRLQRKFKKTNSTSHITIVSFS